MYMHRLTLATCYQLIQSVLRIRRFCTSEMGEVSQAWLQQALYMAAALAGYKMAFVSTRSASVTLLAQTGMETSPLVGAPFLVL